MERVLSTDGVMDIDGKQVFKGLFGEDLVIVDERKEEKPSIAITTKLTNSEYKAVDDWANKFGVSKYKFIRDCIRQQLKDLTMLSE